MATFPLRTKHHQQEKHSERLRRKRDRAEVNGIGPHLLDQVPRGPRYLTMIQLLNRDGGNCYLCGEPLAVAIEVDHIIARHNGGSDHPLNLALACKTCNARKRDLVVAFTIADRRPFFLLP